MSYRLADSIPSETADSLNAYTPLQKQLLFSRGITDTAAAAEFLAPDYEAGLHDPMQLNDMQVAAERILTAIAQKEHVTIFSDYDCDGIPGAVVLHDFFVAAGHENFANYIPHRHYEGFGFSEEAAEKIAENGSKLIITIDCGTSNVEAVQKANELGMDVIITDHHEPGKTLPEALAIVNPKLGDTYPFTELCGAGVVYKLVQALIAAGDFDLVPGYEKWWLDMVGVATIADMVPLVGENRVLAHYGLQVLKKSRRPGLQQLLQKQRVNQKFLTEDDIGFTIGPRINAASRMDTPEDAFKLLTTTDEGEAGAHVTHLEKLNRERKTLVAGMTREVHKRLHELTEMPDVIVLGSPEWRPSLVGLTAGKLAEEFGKPAFVWGKDGNGTFKGSARSDGRVSVVTLMQEIAEFLPEHGGHHHSGGFSVDEEHIHTFPSLLNEAYQKLGTEALIDEDTLIDMELDLEDITDETLQSQRSLAPYGVGNPKPLYRLSGVRPGEVELFGKGKEHTKLKLMTNGRAKEAIAFFATPESFTKTPVPGEPVTLIAHLEESFFMNRLQVRLRIVDIV